MIKVVISEVNPGAAEGLRNDLISQMNGQEEIRVVGYARDGLEVAQLASQLKPDIIFIDEDLPGVSGYEACGLAAAASPDTACVILADSDLNAARVRGMRSGARAVLPREGATSQLGELVKELAKLSSVKKSDEFARVTDPARMPLSYAITAAKGGVGKTTVATNLACLYARRFPGQVVLVDFFGQYGDVALALDLRPNLNIADLSNYEELDVDLVENHLVRHESGLKILAGLSEVDDHMLSKVDVPHLAELIGLLRLRHRFVFFDIPQILWTASRYILSRCNEIIVVANTIDLAALRDTNALLTAIMASYVPPERIRLVANRVSRQNQFDVKDLEEATNMKVVCRIPDDQPTAVGAYNEGKPFVLSAPNSPLTRELHSLMDKLLEGVAV